MKMRGAWGRLVEFTGVVTLLCCVLLVTVRVGTGKHGISWKSSKSFAVAKQVKPLAAQDNLRWAEAYGRLPMSFEENQGQTAREVRYVAHGGRYELFLTPQEAVIALRPTKDLDFSPKHRSAYLRAVREQRRAAKTQTTTAIRMRLEGANPAAQISGAERLPTRVNYFTGSDPKNWHTDVPAYARVKYSDVYPGVDLVFYGNQGRLEYDFLVAPGADPKAIQLKIEGARKMRVNAHGDLVLSVAKGEVEFQKPLVYQQVNGQKREIAGKYVVLGDHRVSFSFADYDRREPLILDPILNYSTYLGGSGAEDYILPVGIAVDSAGDAFVVGETTSVDFPAGTNAGLVANPNPNLGASYVAELNPAGTALLYTTYLIGTTTNGGDGASGVAVDSTGKVYVAGATFAAGFPSKNPLPYSADTTNGTCFVTKLDPTQSGAGALVFSTYLGGTGTDFANGIAVDANENVYVVGQTFSTDFPVMNAYQSTFNAANVNNADGSAFLSRIDTTTSTLVYSTYLSGNDANGATASIPGDQAYGVAVDTSNNAYIVGVTAANNSTNFPSSTNANQTAPPAGNVLGSVFVSKINTAGSGLTSLLYSTYIAGTAAAGSPGDQGFGIALGPNNLVYATGLTNSNDFPVTVGAFDTSGLGSGKAFVSVIDTTKTGVGNSLIYSTPLGGGAGDTGFGIKVDSSGNAYVVGTTASANFPGTNTGTLLGGFQTTLNNPAGSAFIAKLSPGGKGTADLLYSTYFGGSGNGTNPDQGYGIAIDAANPPNAYITGQTSSTNLPTLTTLPGGSALNGTSDGYVAKLSLIPTLVVSPTSLSFGTISMPNTSPAQTVTLTNNTNATIAFTSATFTNGTPAAATTDYVVSANTCAAGIPAGAAPANQCTVSVTFKPSVVGAETATLLLTDGDSTSPQSVSLTGTGAAAGAPGVQLAPSPLPFGGEMLTTTSGPKTVTLTNTGTGALTINSIAASGDYAETSTGATACPIAPATLAAGGMCSINVTFTPTAVGPRPAATLTVTDNAVGSPHTVALTGTGWDFSLAGPAQAPPAITTAAPGKFNITMTPLGGFNQNVALTCAVTPAAADATCTVASPVIAADGVTVQSAAVTVTTTAMMVPPGSVPTPPVSIRQVVPVILALLLLLLLPRTKRLQVRLGMAGAMLLLVILAGCSGPGAPVTQPIPAVLTITGTTSGTPPGVVTHQATVNLTIN